MDFIDYEAYNFVDSIEQVLAGNALPYETTDCKDRWVSDRMMKELIRLEKEKSIDPIFITAQTGSGKSTFVLKHLAEHALKNGKCVLLLSNRVALNLQQKMDFSKEAGLPQMGSAVLKDVVRYKNVYIVTYQSVLKFLHHISRPGQYFPFSEGYVVFDEAHFFCSDSGFNSQTARILFNVLQRTLSARHIYMTATPDEVRPLIAHIEALIRYPNDPKGSIYNLALNRRVIREFVFPENYDYLDIVIFDSQEELVARINKSKDEKWLIFVSSRESGQELAAMLKRYKVKYVDASSKYENSAEFNRIARMSKFNDRVMIATSVLDNGFNIKDDMVKNIVVDSLGEVQMKQMLGRKRVKDGERVTFYIHRITAERLNRHIKRLNDLYYALSMYASDPNGYFRSEWGDFPPDVQHQLEPYFAPGGMGFIPNPFGAYQLAVTLGNYEKMLDNIVEDELRGFEKTVIQWFKKDLSQVSYANDVQREHEEDLRKLFADAMMSQPLNTEEAKKLSAAMAEVVKELKKVGANIPDFRFDDIEKRYQRNINAALKYLNESYIIKKRNNQFTFESTGEEISESTDEEIRSVTYNV